MNIDYNAVIEILKSFLDNEKVEILGISVGEERQVRDAIKNLLTAYEKEKEKNKKEYDRGYKDGFVKGVQPQIFENWNKENARIINIKSQIISKDKIKAKIEEIEKEITEDKKKNDNFWSDYSIYLDAQREGFQSLLEKE